MPKSKTQEPDLDSMSESELADYLYEHRDDPSLWGTKSYPLPPAKKGEGLVFQLRINGKDLDEIALAAYANGGNVSEFFRVAALERARALAGKPGPSAEELARKLDTVQTLVNELQAAVVAVSAAPKKKISRTRKKAPAA
jgi:hypothetical protein